MHCHSELNLPSPNGNLSIKWHLEDWEHPCYFPADKGVYVIAINLDKPSDPTVQGAAQTEENVPDARRLPNEDMSTADM